MDRVERQQAVYDWCVSAFGEEHTNSLQQRAVRFLEEAIELYQACGGDRAMAHKLLDFVMDRPVGDVAQEIGQVGLMILSISKTAGVDPDAEELKEINRVLSKDPAIFAERNRQKNAAGFDTTYVLVCRICHVVGRASCYRGDCGMKGK